MGFRLRVIGGVGAGAELEFDQAAVSFGRSSQCEVVVPDLAVSRRHAQIVRLEDGYFLEDLRSSNGTKLNGARVERVRLADGDELTVGPARFRFHPVAGAPGECTSPDARVGAEQLCRTAVSLFALLWAKGRLGAPGRLARWSSSSRRTRTLLLAAVPLALLAVGVAWFRSGKIAAPMPVEPAALSSTVIEDSFGLGPGVTYPHPDAKAFDLEFDAPGRAVVLLHFQSRDISEGEVVVTANGVGVGSVPPDLLDVDQVFHQITLRSGLLKRGERNRIVFESTRNPPHRDPWRVWNLWVETKALPEMAPDELMREASAAFRRAEQNFGRRDIAASNRYSAWKDFRSAWLMLEALGDPKPDLHWRAQERMTQAQRELDRVCASLLLHLQRSHALKDVASAREALDEVKSYFPGTDQPCPWKAEQRRSQLKL